MVGDQPTSPTTKFANVSYLAKRHEFSGRIRLCFITSGDNHNNRQYRQKRHDNTSHARKKNADKAWK